MEKLLDWQKQVEFEREFGLVNDEYLLGMAVRHIVKKDVDSLLEAKKLIDMEIERLTTIRK